MAAKRSLMDRSVETPAAVRVPRDSTHDATVEWLADHPGLLGEFDAGWVAVADRRIVAYSPSAVEVVRLAREAGVDNPLLVPIMPDEFVGG